MPPKIYNTKELFNFDRLKLSKPINKNGTHFIKTLDIDNPIYFLGPKCFSKNGFVKSGKKIFCDFVFSNEDSDFLAWLENLEESAKKCIYNNRETWFETPLDEHDIESSMASPYKPYKSGKYFIVRANVPTALDKINIKVYDENETETDPENIKENTKVLAVLEFQGIRCSVRSFQFEIELKQILIIEPEKLFETCIISKTPVPASTAKNENENIDAEIDLGNIHTEIEEKEINAENADDDKETKPAEIKNEEYEETTENLDINILPIENENQIEIIDANFPLEDIVDLNLDKTPPLRLKNRNDVYYKLYKEMRQRAKEAKREALANYLEAKRIKNTYLLEDLTESDDDDGLVEEFTDNKSSSF